MSLRVSTRWDPHDIRILRTSLLVSLEDPNFGVVSLDDPNFSVTYYRGCYEVTEGVRSAVGIMNEVSLI